MPEPIEFLEPTLDLVPTRNRLGYQPSLRCRYGRSGSAYRISDSVRDLGVLALGIQVAAYLMQFEHGGSIRLSSIGELAAWKTDYDHWISSLVRTGYRF